jgi:hypothetical protein
VLPVSHGPALRLAAYNTYVNLFAQRGQYRPKVKRTAQRAISPAVPSDSKDKVVEVKLDGAVCPEHVPHTHEVHLVMEGRGQTVCQRRAGSRQRTSSSAVLDSR